MTRGGKARRQLDMFHKAEPLIGIQVNLPRHCKCGHVTLHIGSGCGPHRASLHCFSCGRHCGYLSNEITNFLTEVVEHFGRTRAPVCIRVPRRVLR
jgi:hypothetical protein